MIRRRPDTPVDIGRIKFPFMAQDAFGRLRTAEPFTQLDLKMVSDNQALLYSEALTGSGSATYNANQASVTLAVTEAAGTAIRQSKLRGIYQPGKSLYILQTGILGTTAPGITKRIGYFDEKNGYYFESKDGVFSVVIRTFTSGVAVEKRITQENFNIDKLDGSGNRQNPSGQKINLDATQIFGADLEWLGVGICRLFLVIDGSYVPVHIFLHANTETLVYMSNPNLPIRYEITNDGTGPASDMLMICGTVISEGGLDNNVRSTYVSRLGSPRTLANQDLYTPVISIRLKETHIATRILTESVECFLTSATNAEWILVLNPTIAGTDLASWVPIANSSLEYDITRNATNTISGGATIAGGYLASSNQSRNPITNSLSSLVSLGSGVNVANRDEIVLAIANIEGNGGTAYGSIGVKEFN